MSTKPSTLQSHYHLIFLHSTESRILLLHEQNSWLLPSFHTEEPAHISNAFLIIDTTLRQLGIDAIVLYCAYNRVDRENSQQAVSYQQATSICGAYGRHLKASHAWWRNVLAANTLAALGGDGLVVINPDGYERHGEELWSRLTSNIHIGEIGCARSCLD